jgi:hypothetical protein
MLATPAYALRTNTYVAAAGTDSGACSYSAPCRNFSYALSQVQAGGVVTAIDNAGYSPFTIDKSVTIKAPTGVTPLIIAPSGGIAITITAGPNDKVVLQGLTLDGGGTASDGIDFLGGGSLAVSDCVVRNMTGYGLSVFGSQSSDQLLTVSNSRFDNNQINGIGIGPQSSGGISASIDRSEFSGNGNAGLSIVRPPLGTGVIKAAVTDSVAANNANGIVSAAQGFADVFVTLTHVLIEGSTQNGIFVSNGGQVFLAQSTLTGNASEFNVDFKSALWTYGNNYAAGNPTATGALTPANVQ